jgi:hypothetical protein
MPLHRVVRGARLEMLAQGMYNIYCQLLYVSHVLFAHELGFYDHFVCNKYRSAKKSKRNKRKKTN